MVLLLLLTGGAIVNVAVAWGFALVANPYATEPERTDARGDGATVPTHDVYRLSTLGSVAYSVSTNAGAYFFADDLEFPTVTSLLPSWARVANVSRSNVHIFDGRGWPALALHCAIQSPHAVQHGIVVQDGWETLSSFGATWGWRKVPRVLPLRPIWPGFAINTIFYAAILWLLWIAPGKIRRFIRAKRHRCPACGYQIAEGVGPVCSECGAALPQAMRG